ncbi:MAG: class D beta-lactamase [Lachnospiraceae bacterium]|nr:class D beta-lactamase [Lachnospiraceae bacterium]
MKKWTLCIKFICNIFVSALLISGCSANGNTEIKQSSTGNNKTEDVSDIYSVTDIPVTKKPSIKPSFTQTPEPEIIPTDLSAYFNGLNGAAVIYNASSGKYTIYNKKLAFKRKSPCSTFKIISSLIALENGIIKPGKSIRKWSGEIFWNDSWNTDIGFKEAFQTSCIWYFREVIDETGKKEMQKQLNKLQYGNCDISDWKGKLNTNNNNRSLTGFWVESSLKISPKEQTEVMERIFGNQSVYSQKSQKRLKDAMLVTEKNKAGIPIYGKTGTGVKQGTTIDAWFTGTAGTEENQVYFCIYLGKTNNREVNSSIAKEIAIQIISDYYTH